MKNLDTSPSLVFYDTETTGTNVKFDQILQFAAILTTHDLKELDRFEVKCRRLPWIVPSPMAMRITGVDPQSLHDQTLPLFPEMIEKIRDKLVSWSPAIFAGYNSFRFDENLLQHAFWQNLLPPYLTVSNGNGRLDILPLARAASRLSAHALAIPKGPHGRPSYRLDRLAPLNGFPQRNAHDALEDVEATIHITKRIASRAPKLWASALEQTNKERVLDILLQMSPVFVIEPDATGKSGWWGHYLGQDQARSSIHLLARLECDWNSFLMWDDADRRKFLSGYPWPITRVTPNRAPPILSEKTARSEFGIVPSKKEADVVKILSNNRDKLSFLIRSHDLNRHSRSKPIELEERIFEGFPSRSDEQLMRKFHSLPWAERGPLIRQFEDSRFQQLAQRLVYLMAPSTMRPEEIARVRGGIRSRLIQETEDAPIWRTIEMAKNELKNLPPELSQDYAWRKGVMNWLNSLAKSA